MPQFETIASALILPEGPVAMPDGSVIVVEVLAGQVTRCWPGDRKEIVATSGGGPNGLAFGPDGKLWCVNNGGFQTVRDATGREHRYGVGSDYQGGWVERIDIATGAVEVVYRSGDFGHRLRGPNDLVFDVGGGFWFTDHGKHDFVRRTHDVTGVFHAASDGSKLDEVIFPLNGANGIGISPDGGTIYVAETPTCRLLRFAVTGCGEIEQAGQGAANFLHRPGGAGSFDSLAVEACGNICVATPGTGGITVISPEGELVEFVDTGDVMTTNICFGGPDMQDAWITLAASGRLVKTRWPRPGLRLNFQPG